MSGRGRGGRGGGRGGRGGFGAQRKAGPQGMPGADDPSLQFNEKPQDTYPKTYKPPVAPHLSPAEERSVAAFVAFRRAFQGTPLYTHRHLTSGVSDDAATSKPTDPVRRTYGQSQLNARFGVKSRATADPFRAVPLYSHKFEDEVRTLPELRRRADRYVKAFFPEELWATLHGRDAGGPKGGFLATKEKKGTKRKAVVLDDDPTVSDDDAEGASWRRRREDETEEERKKRIDASIKEGENEDTENKEDIDLEEEEEQMSQEDDDYDDDDEGGDYDAEQYFDGGDADDFGEDEGVGESAMDF
ncbi:DNA-directed RNA polymerase III, subunit Rpc31 [Annulohypoxylon bovei var. microspora]|nr:DNA-directed RNA polymerase III, subunit Rpc31 [Annulohypoxylon bovei var. microspora]